MYGRRRCSLALSLPLGLGDDWFERGADGLLRGADDTVAPPGAERPEVGSELALPGEAGPAVAGLQAEGFDQVGDGAADDAEVDPLGRVNRTVSTVFVTPHLTWVKCAASTMSAPRSQTCSLSSRAHGVLPR